MPSTSSSSEDHEKGNEYEAAAATSPPHDPAPIMQQDKDLEMGGIGGGAAHQLDNTLVDSFAWEDLDVTVKDRNNAKSPLSILSKSSGHVRRGEMLAIMGPSGSGKTTLLNALAHRVAAAGAVTKGKIIVNGGKENVDLRVIRSLSAYVEQEDALIGSLTVRETVGFAARLSVSRNVPRKEMYRLVESLILSFGLQGQANTIVGTPIKKGLSGGQKKRLGIASRLVTNPKILFLDEPTSGLDSALSVEVVSYIKEVARRHKIIIIASIHQPSTSTFEKFDKLCLLSGGKTCYFGNIQEAPSFLSGIGHPLPPQTNPAEFYLDLINTDLDRSGEVLNRTNHITHSWSLSPQQKALSTTIRDLSSSSSASDDLLSVTSSSSSGPHPLSIPLVLLYRSWIKSYRDVVAYGIRIAMYLGLAILMGTVFLRLGSDQQSIQPFINAIFFGGAFMSFMAVAYVPAFLEDLQTFHQERANGLVGPGSFMLANFLIGIPYLFLIAVLFSVVEYWLSGFRADAGAFFTWILWLFLDLLAAESLVVLVSSIFPIFVVALAFTAFANGLWMCVDGFLVPMGTLNVFWKYVFHYIDYQAYVFQGMMVNEFRQREYDCARSSNGEFQCMYPSDLNAVGKIRGTSVLQAFSIDTGLEGTWIGIAIGIIAGYRLLGYLVLVLRK